VDTQQKIKQQLTSDKIVLYMKGTPEAPMCGFSAQTVKLLTAVGAKYSSFDVLSDEEIRQGVKSYSNWPTFPQLYINGELVGGCDIVTELYRKGELQKLVAKAQAAYAARADSFRQGCRTAALCHVPRSAPPETLVFCAQPR